MRILSRVALLSLTTAAAAHAATVVYDFNVSWITANPDGLAERPVIGINNQWPPPRIDVQVGDRLIVNLHNSLGDEDTSLHFHGLFMNGSNHMDGPVMVTQCPIPPGASFTYNFTVDQPGTYWYHSHNKGQYPDGFRGPLVIHDPKAPFEYDEELVLTVSDWYHDRMSLLQPRFMSKYNPTGAEPVPKSALMNDTQNLTMPMVPDRTYLFRIANIGAFAGQYIWVEDHTITVVEMDGVYVHPTETNMVYVAAAQRCSFLLTAKKETSRNFPIIASMDTTLFDTIPDGLNTNVTSYLLYNPTAPLPLPTPLDSLTPLNDALLLPQDNLTTLPSPDQTITLNVTMNNLASGANYAFFNDITYVPPRVPTLYTVLSSPNSSSSQEDLTTNPSIYGTYTHPFILSHNSIVQLVLNNLDSGRHPFHLHGHQFQILHRSAADEGTWSPSSPSSSSISSFSTSNPNNSNHTAAPMRRDTLVVEPNGNAVIRFQADNPGVWLFHCHIEWHMISGLAVTFIEAPSVLQQTITLPADHLAACRDRQDPIPIEGNAAGRGGAKNDADVSQWLVLDGQPSPPKPIPAGFTGGGIAALTMSCFTGILGVAVVAWYGFSEPVGEESNSASASAAAAVKTKSPAAAGESGSESGVYTDVDSAGKSASVVRVKRGTEAVESEALSFGSEEEAVNGVGMATSKNLKGDGVVVDVDAITRA